MQNSGGAQVPLTARTLAAGLEVQVRVPREGAGRRGAQRQRALVTLLCGHRVTEMGTCVANTWKGMQEAIGQLDALLAGRARSLCGQNEIIALGPSGRASKAHS